jgi:hypothetical protein
MRAMSIMMSTSEFVFWNITVGCRASGRYVLAKAKDQEHSIGTNESNEYHDEYL